MYAISRPREKRQHKIDVIAKIPLKPSEYCRRWVPGDPSERGYKKLCIHSIAKVTGLSPRSIERWGENLDECPDYIGVMLRKQDVLNQIRELASSALDEQIEE